MVFAGGGTGGHLFPALALVETLASRGDPVDISFFCTDRPIDHQILDAAGSHGVTHVEIVPQRVLPVATRPWEWPRFLLRWHETVRMCKDAFRRRRPAVVVGTGGYASGPAVHAAVGMGIPTFLLNPDAVPGRANQYLATRSSVHAVFAQWEVTRRHFPRHARVEVTGCPVRSAFRGGSATDVRAIRESFGLDPSRRVLLVTGASQGARTINEAMMRLAGSLDFGGWQVLHLAGAAHVQAVEEAYGRSGSALGMWRFRGRVLPFTERMAEAVAAADLILSRAGASTLAEILAAGKPSVLMPYPYHRDQHQRHNAMVLVEAGAAALVPDEKQDELNALRLGPVLAQLIQDERRRQAMAEAAQQLDRPEAAPRIVDRLLEAAGLRQNGDVAASQAADSPNGGADESGEMAVSSLTRQSA